MTKLNAAIWTEILASRPNPVFARDVALTTGASLPFTRKLLRVWAQAGFIDRHPASSTARDAADSYSAPFDAPRHPPIVTASERVIPSEPAMTAAEFASIRRQLGHSLADMGRALGWAGKQPSISRAMKHFETGARVIDAGLAGKIASLITARPSPNTISPGRG